MSAIVSVKLKGVVTPEGRRERVPDLAQIGLPLPAEAAQVIFVAPDEALVKVDLLVLLRQLLSRIERLERQVGHPPP
jgi:hypothetical protein